MSTRPAPAPCRHCGAVAPTLPHLCAPQLARHGHPCDRAGHAPDRSGECLRCGARTTRAAGRYLPGLWSVAT